MPKSIMVVFIGMFSILLALAACSQSNPPAIPAPTLPPAPPTAAPSATAGVVATATATTAPTQPPTAAPPTNTPAPSATPTTVNRTPLPDVISGIVKDANGPVAKAIVQLQGHETQVHTDASGRYQMKGPGGTTPVTLTAWSAGYYVGWVILNPSAPDWKGASAVDITLKSVPQTDNAKYPWFSFNGVTGSASCGLCHREYKEWEADAHSQSAINPRFLSVYTGSDIQGNPGQPVKFDLKGLPLPPDPNQPYYGSGFQLDNPSRAGNCATCHTPAASKVPNDQNCGWSGCHTSLTIERSGGVIKPHTLPITSGVGLEGMPCDFCHKIAEVIIDPKTRLPKPDMPGILSMRLTRPEEGQQIFYGTLVDVPRRDTYLPLLDQSEYCAPCHYGVFGGVMGSGTVTGGVTIYNSYGEWLNSPYSDPKTGKTCQQCHMPVVPEKFFVFPDAGGLNRDYVKLHGHTMPGVSDQKLMQNAVSLSAKAQRSGDLLQVEVKITNDQTGHDIPTEAPIRSMILVVEAVDSAGKVLALGEGPTNPAWSGNYGGKPGKTYARVLRDDWTGETPTTAYWRPVTEVEDTRLHALASDTTRYAFNLPAGQTARINVRLVFRRAFQGLAQQKGWNDPDILMKENTIQVEK